MQNKAVRRALFEVGMKQWELAKLLNISEAHMSRILRVELPEDEQKKIVSLIEAREGRNETSANY